MVDVPEVPEESPRDGRGRAADDRPWQLPQLVGRRLLIFRIFWSFALLLAVTAPLASFHFARVNDAELYLPYNDLGLRGSPSGLLGRPLGGEARTQGVEEGAKVLGIDGKAVSDHASRREIATLLKAAPGPLVDLTTRTAQGETRSHRLSRSKRHVQEVERAAGISVDQRQLITRSLSTLAAAAAVLAALLLFLRRPRDPVAGLLSLGCLLIAATAGFASTAWTSLDAPRFLGSAVNSLGLLAAGLALITFPHGRFDSRWSGPIAVALIGWCSFLPINHQLDFMRPGPGNAVTAAVFMACLALLVGRFRGLPQGVERQQIRWVLFGFAVAVAAGLVNACASMLGASSHDEPTRLWAGVAASVATAFMTFSLAFGLLVSLLRYRLYDAEAAISRSAAVTVLTLTLAAVYAGASKGLETYFETTFGREAGATPGAIGAALAVLLFLPLNRRIQLWAERRFQAPLLRLRRDLPVCLGDMRETASMAAVAEETLEGLTEGVRARHSALILDGKVLAACNIAPTEVEAWYEAGCIDRSQTIDCAPEDGLFPMRLKLRPRSGEAAPELGWILLGPRPDGSFFGKDEREVLGEIVDPAARAIEIVQLRESKEAEVDRRIRSIEERLLKAPKRQSPAGPRLVRPAG